MPLSADAAEPAPAAGTLPGWELFCRVIDNRGDAGVAWRLARNLARRGQSVRLWIDQPQALEGMADAVDLQLVAAGQVQVRGWPSEPDGGCGGALQATLTQWSPRPGTQAVVELFGCTLPSAVQRWLALPDAPVWVNLEYLSAEPYVRRSHRLASPRNDGPGAGAVTWFFYPGFTEGTGGLMREDAWAPSEPRVARAPADLQVSRFDYDPPHALPWLHGWARARPQGVLHLVVPGAAKAAGQATHADEAACEPPNTPSTPPGAPGRLRLHARPWLTQAAYDALLAASDLNLVRGEDSFVRAQWAGKPLLWQIYPQHDGAHAAKLEAWLDLYLDGASSTLAGTVRRVHRWWNQVPGAGPVPAGGALQALDDALLRDWRLHAQAWNRALRQRPDLARQLMDFVAEKRRAVTARGNAFPAKLE